ncbi:hypothetical protein JHK85_007847 [Glycine max]|nr:hypothetical protein JHK85_007847 [Glycine max]KHN10706.1 Putative uridine kinase [Glycine soja]
MEATFSSTTARGYWNLALASPAAIVETYGAVDSSGKKRISRVDELYDTLVTRLLPSVSVSSNPNHKLLVGLAGPPGAGKSTLAHEVARRINKLWPEKASSFDSLVEPPDVAIVVPMDGFHLYRFELDAMENLEEAHARRGAPWTFNPLGLLTYLKNLRSHGSVYVPSFDHGVGDPVKIFLCFLPLCRLKVVIVEGNYLLLEDGQWKEISSLFDEKWQALILPRHMFLHIFSCWPLLRFDCWNCLTNYSR